MSFFRIRNSAFTWNLCLVMCISAWRSYTWLLLTTERLKTGLSPRSSPEVSWIIPVKSHEDCYALQLLWVSQRNMLPREKQNLQMCWKYKHSNMITFHCIAPILFQWSNSVTFIIYRHIFKQCMLKDKYFSFIPLFPEPKDYGWAETARLSSP